MQLKSARTISELSEVIFDPKNLSADQKAYWVFNEVTTDKWENMTVLAPLDFNGEFNKTYGHYHSTNVLETYKLLSGTGILMLQKKLLKDGVWVPEKVEKVYLVAVRPDEEVKIPWEYGHAWHNLGTTPLVSLDDWRSGHQDSDYAEIKRLRGMSYYMINDNGTAGLIPNPEYKDLPQPEWISTDEFHSLTGQPL